MKPRDNFEQILWKCLNQRWKISGIFLNNFRVFSKIIPDLKKQKNKKNYDKYTRAYHILVIPWLTCKGLIGYTLPCIAQRSWSSFLYICLWANIAKRNRFSFAGTNNIQRSSSGAGSSLQNMVFQKTRSRKSKFSPSLLRPLSGTEVGSIE